MVPTLTALRIPSRGLGGCLEEAGPASKEEGKSPLDKDTMPILGQPEADSGEAGAQVGQRMHTPQ